MNGFQTFFTSGDVGAHTESLQPRSNSSGSSEDKASQAPVPAVTTSGASQSATAAAESTSDDCCELCLVAPRVGSHWCRADMRCSVNPVLCACHIWMRDALFFVRYGV